MFEKLTAYLDSFHERFGIPGLDCVIWQRHSPIYRHYIGFAESNKARPIHTNNLYWIYSASKVATATAALQIIQDRRLGLDDVVADYLPTFSQLRVPLSLATMHKNTPTRLTRCGPLGTVLRNGRIVRTNNFRIVVTADHINDGFTLQDVFQRRPHRL